MVAIGAGERKRRSSGFKVEVRQYFPIGQWFQKQLLREFFFMENRSEGDCGEADLEGKYEEEGVSWSW